MKDDIIGRAIAQAREIDPDQTGENRAALLEISAGFPANDFGNGQRLVCHFGRDLLFVPRLGWFRWDGRRWAADEDEIAARRDAQAIARIIGEEADFLALEEWQSEAVERWDMHRQEFEGLRKKRKREEVEEARYQALLEEIEPGRELSGMLARLRAGHRKFAIASGNTNKIGNMLTEAKTMVSASILDLNCDPNMVNTETGVIRFFWQGDEHSAAWGGARRRAAYEVVPHDRDHKISKMIRAPFSESAKCPEWVRFWERIQPNRENRDFLQRWFGYCLTGHTSEQKLAFFYGGGRNGKSTAVDLLARIWDDYATTIPIESLTGDQMRKGSDATPDLVRLPGARFVRASEPEQGTKMKEATIKALTGGEAILVRRMMQEFIEVKPEFKLTIQGNHKPRVTGADDGIWRRIMLVPFLEQIAPEEVDPDLPAKLWAERAGILNWLIEGCLAWMERGLDVPASISAATDAYRMESDPMRVWLETYCEITGNPNDFTSGRDLCDAFNAWLLARGESAWTRRTVALRLKEREGAIKGPSGAVYQQGKRSDTGYRGIAILPEGMDLIAAHSDAVRGVK